MDSEIWILAVTLLPNDIINFGLLRAGPSDHDNPLAMTLSRKYCDLSVDTSTYVHL